MKSNNADWSKPFWKGETKWTFEFSDRAVLCEKNLIKKNKLLSLFHHSLWWWYPDIFFCSSKNRKNMLMSFAMIKRNFWVNYFAYFKLNNLTEGNWWVHRRTGRDFDFCINEQWTNPDLCMLTWQYSTSGLWTL